MKKLTLLFVFMCWFALVFSQSHKTEKDVLGKAEQYSMPPSGSELAKGFQDLNRGNLNTKGGGDLIWGTTFNWENPADPNGWSLPAGWSRIDNSQLGNDWIWRKDTIVHYYYRDSPKTKAVPPSWFDTANDGYLCMPLSDYNNRDGIGTSNVIDASITTPPIDCSKASSVCVKFNQYFVYCCSAYNLEMQVTNDGGSHWANYDVKHNVSGNIITPARFGRIDINVSDVAAGMPNVQIRFYVHGFVHYYWIIDDLRLTEAYENELVLEDTWMDFEGGAGATIDHINYWPKSQMGMAGTPSGTVGDNYFKAALLNNGTADAENAKLNLKILKNGTEIENLFSTGAAIWSLDRDTQNIVNPWQAPDFGDYRFDFIAVSDNPEDVPSNNTASQFFTVNDTLGHRADFTAEAAANTGGWSNGGRAGDMVCANYSLFAPAEINSITAYFAGFVASQTPQFQFVLLKDIDGTYEELITSDVIDMDSTRMYSWNTLPLVKDGETEFLTPGNYYTAVRMWGSSPTATYGTQGISVGRDLSTKFSGTPVWYTYDGAWHNLAGAPLFMIGFNINATGGPTQAPATFNVDMTHHIASGEFKPATDFVDVAGSFNGWGGSAHLTDPEGDGIYTITVAGLPVNKVIEYKYRINGSWNTSEFPSGGPNRKYTVRYWNVLNDVYNGGVAAGVNTNNLTASFNVYPNPTSGAFNVEISNTAASDLIITLTNIEGQVVYQNKVANALNHRETIDNKLSKGLYFLSVNNGKEVKVQKVVIQ